MFNQFRNLVLRIGAHFPASQPMPRNFVFANPNRVLHHAHPCTSYAHLTRIIEIRSIDSTKIDIFLRGHTPQWNHYTTFCLDH